MWAVLINIGIERKMDCQTVSVHSNQHHWPPMTGYQGGINYQSHVHRTVQGNTGNPAIVAELVVARPAAKDVREAMVVTVHWESWQPWEHYRGLLQR